MSVLNRYLRVVVGADEDSTVVGSSSPVRFQQALEDAVTAVVELTSAQESPVLAANQRVRLDLIQRGSVPADGYSVGPIFRGTLDQFRGVSSPHAVNLLAKGPLARLRRSFDADYDLSDLTDEDAVSAILTRCGISHDSADIDGTGYVLGAHEPVIWRAGQAGAEVVPEIDRVFGCATIEIESARIIRFPYSRVPAHYDPATYAATYRRGQAGVNFYEHERARGDLDQIRNYWRIQGLGYDGAEGTADEGCTFQVWATGKADNATLGAGRLVGPDVFSSDLIQSEARAKAIAQRLMSWWNRLPDTIRIVAPLDVDVIAGSLVLVRDNAYGVDLTSDTAYLVYNKGFEGESSMTLDCIGGPSGVIGTLTSGIDRCCGTQQEDGTCTDVGTNPDPDFPGGGLGGIDTPGWPELPPLPDIDICDPLTDPLCVLEPPGGGTTEPPNTEDPFVDCTETGNLIDVVSAPWRESGSILYDLGEGGLVADAIFTTSAGSIFHNVTEGPTPKTDANDVFYGQGETVCVTGILAFPCAVGDGTSSTVTITLERVEDEGTTITASISFHSEPGVQPALVGHVGEYWFGIRANPEGDIATWAPSMEPGVCTWVPNEGNNGGYEGTPIPYGSEVSFSVCFDTGSSPPRTTFDSSVGGGYTEDVFYTCRPFGPWPPPDPCDHPSGHRLRIDLNGSFFATADLSCPWVELRELSIGSATCVPNPDYVPPERSLSDGRG